MSSNTTVPRSGEGSTTRAECGLELYRERWADIRFERGAWMIPSATDAERTYAVRLGPVPRCECADHEYRGSHCLHIAAATLARAKTSPCSCCGQRVPNRFVTEVLEDHELLSWFPGDLLCGSCVGDGYWC